MDESSATFRIQAVSRMTGVPTATLRAWERRYGVPAPGRTASAYRLYSAQEIERVRRMKELIERGMSASDAARALSDVEPEPEAVSADPFAEVAARIVDTAAVLDVSGLQLEIRRAVALDSAWVAFDRILRPAMIAVGDRWHAGELSVAAEHLASHAVSAAALDLLRLIPTAPGAPSVVLGCFADEEHVLPLYGAAIELATWGFRPIVLGGRCPPEAVARAVEALAPGVVGLSATVTPGSPAKARELVEGYADACAGTPLVLGGLGATALAPWAEARGVLIAPDAPEARKALFNRALSAGRGAPLTDRRRGSDLRPPRSRTKR